MLSYKPLIRVLVLLTLLNLTQTTHADNSKYEFSLMVAPSLLNESMDLWYHTPQESAPYIRTVSSVTRDQPFQLLVFAAGYALDGQKQANVSYDMQVYDPAGKPTEDQLVDRELYKGKSSEPTPLLLSRELPKIIFTEKYPLGRYTIKVTAHDNIAAKTITLSKSITLKSFSMPERFESEDAVGKWMMGYYQEPTPAKSIPAIITAVKTDSKWLDKNLNILTFFRTILHDNPYLLTRIAEHKNQLSTEDMKKILTVLAIMDMHEAEPVLNVISDEQHDYYQDARTIQIPSTDSEITTATQLDILWSEFLATGKYEPIKKIVGSLALQKYSGTLKKLKAGELDKNDPEVRRKAYLDATYSSALWSLISNCKQLDLVFQYCIYIYQNEPLDDGIKRQLYTILTIAQEKREKAPADKSGD